MHKIFILIAALLLLPTVAARAELCASCKDRSYTKDIGSCKECGGMTMSGEFQLCMACSSKLHQCEHCRAALPDKKPASVAGTSKVQTIDPKKDGTYVDGRWHYKYAISNEGSRSEGYYGELSWDGKPLAAPAALNDYYQTPWGPLYWVGRPIVAFGVHGWMPKPLAREKVGQKLPEPRMAAEPTPSLAVFYRVIYPDRNPGPGAKPLEPWIADELKHLGVQIPSGAGEWKALRSEVHTLHDSKHYGLCQIRLAGKTEDNQFRVEVMGGHEPVVNLPAKSGATKLLPCTLTSSVASMDLYIAIKVDANTGP